MFLKDPSWELKFKELNLNLCLSSEPSITRWLTAVEYSFHNFEKVKDLISNHDLDTANTITKAIDIMLK